MVVKKTCFAVFLILILSSFALAEIENLNIKTKSDVIVRGTDNPAYYEFEFTSTNDKEIFEIYTLFDVSMFPKNKLEITKGVVDIDVTIYPGEKLRKNYGPVSFEYQIKGEKSGIYKGDLVFNVLELQDIFEIRPENLHPDNKILKVNIKNIRNAYLEDVKFAFDSEFFESESILSFKPFEEKSIELIVNKEISKLGSGPYILKSDVRAGSAKAELEGVFDYLEREGTSVHKESSGFFIRENKITKINEGNTFVKSRIDVDKNVLTRLFTSHTPEPDSISRNGLGVNYIWEKNLAPGNSMEIISRTNYFIPLFIILLVGFVVYGIRNYSFHPIVLKKNVSLVRTKGGEFALKVNLFVKARSHTDNIKITDSLPAMTKLYEKFGRKPDEIDEKTRRLIWNIPRLNRGEERVFSYVIYSKLRVVGKFELPSANAVFENNGKTETVFSNRAYFASESLVRKSSF